MQHSSQDLKADVARPLMAEEGGMGVVEVALGQVHVVAKQLRHGGLRQRRSERSRRGVKARAYSNTGEQTERAWCRREGDAALGAH